MLKLYGCARHMPCCVIIGLFFFFQAEDGIRDYKVTGVQTCALPICLVVGEPVRLRFFGSSVRRADQVGTVLDFWGPEELVELQEIEAHLPAEGRAPGEIVPVTLHARVTDIGDRKSVV